MEIGTGTSSNMGYEGKGGKRGYIRGQIKLTII